MEATLYTAQIVRENAFGEFVMESITMEFAHEQFGFWAPMVVIVEADDLEVGMVQLSLDADRMADLDAAGSLFFRGIDPNWTLQVELP